MAECELLSGCLFFNDKMAKLDVTAALMKIRYCKGNNSDCARYMVYEKLGRDHVPNDLYPGQIEKAKKIFKV